MDARRGTYCPERWAKDSNTIVCDYCYGRWVNGTDLLDSGYAAGALHIVEHQIAKAAWRLSGWFNFLAARLLGPSEVIGLGGEGALINVPGLNARVGGGSARQCVSTGDDEL